MDATGDTALRPAGSPTRAWWDDRLWWPLVRSDGVRSFGASGCRRADPRRLAKKKFRHAPCPTPFSAHLRVARDQFHQPKELPHVR